jgi:benzoyl-CoA reductase/2-hydroxyglutaryl-CoA dehydratase subunit BcrC/BadD/HgdB
MEEKRLAAYLKDRPEQLRRARKDGVKLIGYFPGNYVPEEIIYASGAIPLCLTHGGDPAVSEAALSTLPRLMCPFARAQIGERLIGTNPYYSLLDMLVAPITCQHLKKVAEVWEYTGEFEIFKLGVPHQYCHDFELEYYVDRLRALKDNLQAFTGIEITDKKLGQAIGLYNKMRECLKKISLARSIFPGLISAGDFIQLNQASFYADPVFMTDVLESVYSKLMNTRSPAATDSPRILLMGPNIANGDHKVLDLVKDAGGEIVIEEISEGLRYYWNTIPNEGDLYQSLARGYLVDRVPCAFMRSSSKKRLDFALKLVRDFNVAGVIWYELLGCETYDSESYYFARQLEERHIPMLTLESDYGTADTGQLRTRIEAFFEILKGVT